MKSLRFLACALPLLQPVIAAAQTQIRPRVILMVDTSGSMTEAMQPTSGNNFRDTGGDGSISFVDNLMTRDYSTLAAGPVLYFRLEKVCHPRVCWPPPPNGRRYHRRNHRTFASPAAAAHMPHS